MGGLICSVMAIIVILIHTRIPPPQTGYFLRGLSRYCSVQTPPPSYPVPDTFCPQVTDLNGFTSIDAEVAFFTGSGKNGGVSITPSIAQALPVKTTEAAVSQHELPQPAPVHLLFSFRRQPVGDRGMDCCTVDESGEVRCGDACDGDDCDENCEEAEKGRIKARRSGGGGGGQAGHVIAHGGSGDHKHSHKHGHEHSHKHDSAVAGDHDKEAGNAADSAHSKSPAPRKSRDIMDVDVDETVVNGNTEKHEHSGASSGTARSEVRKKRGAAREGNESDTREDPRERKRSKGRANSEEEAERVDEVVTADGADEEGLDDVSAIVLLVEVAVLLLRGWGPC